MSIVQSSYCIHIFSFCVTQSHLFYITKIVVLCVTEVRIFIIGVGILYVKVVEVTVMLLTSRFFQTVDLNFFICLDAMFVLIHK
jgi:hypothetical protein